MLSRIGIATAESTILLELATGLINLTYLSLHFAYICAKYL
jgi:hypothetical protein